MQFLNDYSNRELNIWAELVLDIIVSLYFISRAYPLLINDQFNSEALLPIIFTNIIISIIYSIIVFGAIDIFTKKEEKDERDYFYELKFVGLPEGTTDYDLVVTLFSNPYYTAVYVASFIVLGFHLNHGFSSAFQSAGANHKKYNPIIKAVSTGYSIFIALGFSTIAIFHFFNQYNFN